MQRAYGTVKLKVGRISSLHSFLSSSKTAASYINHALEDDRGKYTLFIAFQKMPNQQIKSHNPFRDQQGIPAVE